MNARTLIAGLFFTAITHSALADTPVKTAAVSSKTTASTPTPSMQLIDKLQKLSTLRAQFVQKTTNPKRKLVQVLKGELHVARPNKMRWHTQPPYEQLVISDGKSLWTYDQDLEQVSIRNVDASAKETPALLLSGDASKVAQRFDISIKDKATFVLTPKDQSQLFESLEFTYQGDVLDRILIVDAAGQTTDIRLTQQRLNTAIDAGTFVFKAPEGVDVIDGRH